MFKKKSTTMDVDRYRFLKTKHLMFLPVVNVSKKNQINI